jgi:ribosomal protein S18 acetylase RimI-like enzyme
MSIAIREALERDNVELLALVNNELGYNEVTLDELSSRMSKMKENGNYYVFVAISGDSLVGFISVIQGIALEIKNDYFRILELAVSETYQNSGIGKTLLRYVESFAKERGLSSYITLSCGLQRTSAHSFYEHSGFNKTSFAFAKGSKRS